MRRSAQRRTLESVQTDIDELEAQTAMVERQLAKAQENQDKEVMCRCQERLLELAKCLAEQEKCLAEQEKYQEEQDLLLLRAQTAGWFAADQCGLCLSNMCSL